MKTMSYFNHTYMRNYGGEKPCVYINGQYFVQCYVKGQVTILLTTYNMYCKLYLDRNGDSQINWCGCGTGMKSVPAQGSELITIMLQFFETKERTMFEQLNPYSKTNLPEREPVIQCCNFTGKFLRWC
ncbi:uncharacterized protein LOC143445289 isoform X1 [Clavelina lepadiformis]|uniref:uncharacterized protein LOC143445289 isoform X1 n=1 Tax=Clavelina lepadiformis TaxID=159417 RepID=UPI00404211DC